MRWLARRRRRWEVTADLEMPPWYPLALGMSTAEFTALVQQSLQHADPWQPMDDAVAETCAAEVAGWAATLREVPGIVDAAVLRPACDGPVEAVMAMSLSDWPGNRSLEEFVEEHRDGTPYDLDEVELPVGRALRVHQVRPFDDSTVESVGHCFRALDGVVVWHEIFWAGTGEHRWCDRADAVARSLTFS